MQRPNPIRSDVNILVPNRARGRPTVSSAPAVVSRDHPLCFIDEVQLTSIAAPARHVATRTRDAALAADIRKTAT